MRPELERSLRRAALGKYLIEAARADASIEEALEQGFQNGVIQERERQLAISRVASEEALEAAELLASTIQRVPKRR